jgi:hypothetical protein
MFFRRRCNIANLALARRLGRLCPEMAANWRSTSFREGSARFWFVRHDELKARRLFHRVEKIIVEYGKT